MFILISVSSSDFQPIFPAYFFIFLNLDSSRVGQLCWWLGGLPSGGESLAKG